MGEMNEIRYLISCIFFFVKHIKEKIANKINISKGAYCFRGSRILFFSKKDEAKYNIPKIKL
jgi:hypothetical protein